MVTDRIQFIWSYASKEKHCSYAKERMEHLENQTAALENEVESLKRQIAVVEPFHIMSKKNRHSVRESYWER